jgi:hypothetical protein
MTRVAVKVILLALVVGSTIAGFQPDQRVRSKRNRHPKIQAFTTSTAEVIYCPFDAGGICSSTGTIVTLGVDAMDPDNETLTYTYSVSAGTIVGTGATVNWDLYKTPFGMQTVTIEVSDQRGGKATSTAKVKVMVCGACDPPCPSLSVTCPAEVNLGNEANFIASVSSDGEKLTFLWRHSNGQRLSTQAGPNLKIKAVGFPGDVITATVDVLGLDPACSRQASCESRIVRPVPYR